MQLIDVTVADARQALHAHRSAAAPTQLRPRRGPRAEEIALMHSLAAGPRAVTSGPIGRCVKRDWCRAVVVEEGEGLERRSRVLFALTEMGRALIA